MDPADRIGLVANLEDNSEAARFKYGYSDDSDSPTNIQESRDGGATWSNTRYVTVPGLGMVATISNDATVFQLANLHGDVVATQLHAANGPLAIDAYHENDEYGKPIEPRDSNRYEWLGSQQRSSDTLGGIVLMGARIYNPATGLFTSPDPIVGGGANPYAYPTDPINQWDPNGESWSWIWEQGIDFLEEILSTGCRATIAGVFCAAAVGGIISSIKYFVSLRGKKRFSWDGLGNAAAGGAIGGIVGFLGGKSLSSKKKASLVSSVGYAFDILKRKVRQFARRSGLKKLANNIGRIMSVAKYYVQYYLAMYSDYF